MRVLSLVRPVAVVSGGGGGGGPSLAVTHTGIATFVKIDTTLLWSSRGGSLSGAQVLLVDGVDASTVYGTGYPGHPQDPSGGANVAVTTLAMSVGTHVLSVGPYSATIDVYWRGWPWKSIQGDAAVSANAVFFNGALPATTTIPGPGNNWGDGAGYQNMAVNNNGYAQLLDAAPSTRAVFITASGDEGFVLSGTPTADERAEPNITDLNFIPVDGSGNDLRPLDGNGVRNLDLFANTSFTTRFYRLDGEFPATVTAPVPIQNTSNVGILTTLSGAGLPLSTGAPIVSLPIAAAKFGIGFSNAVTITLDDGAGHTQTWTTGAAIALNATAITVASQTPSFAFPAGTNVKIAWSEYRRSFNQNHKWPDGVTTNPATGDLTASATVVNAASSMQVLSNTMEDDGPTVIAWNGGTSGGASGSRQFRYQPTSLGVGLTQLTFDTKTVTFDPGDHSQQESTILERRPHLFGTTNGVPWIISDPTDPKAPLSSKHTGISTPNGGGDGVIAGTGFAANMVGQQWGFDQAGAVVYTVASFQSSTQITMTTAVPALSGATMYQLPIAPYGVPPGTPGGGYLRIWRRVATVTVNARTYTNCWHCVTEGNANAVSGTCPIYDDSGNVLNVLDAPFNADSGKVFGPTIKCQGAKLATTMNANTTGPISVTNVQSGTAFRPTNGGIAALWSPGNQFELVRFTGYSNGVLTIASNGRGILGTTAAAHAIGDQVAGIVDVLVLSPGVNQDQNAPVPFVAAQWPPKVGPTMASVISAPLV